MCLEDVQELCSIGERPWASKLHQNEDPGYLGLSWSRAKSSGKAYQWNWDVPNDFWEPIEPIDEEAGDLGDLEDMSESEPTQESTDLTEEEKGENPDQCVSLVQPVVTDLLLD